MPTFEQLTHAARCGFVYDQNGRFIRFFVRGDRKGYDVDVCSPEAVGKYLMDTPLQFHFLTLDQETVRRLVQASRPLYEACVAPFARMRLALTHKGETLNDGPALAQESL